MVAMRVALGHIQETETDDIRLVQITFINFILCEWEDIPAAKKTQLFDRFHEIQKALNPSYVVPPNRLDGSHVTCAYLSLTKPERVKLTLKPGIHPSEKGSLDRDKLETALASEGKKMSYSEGRGDGLYRAILRGLKDRGLCPTLQSLRDCLREKHVVTPSNSNQSAQDKAALLGTIWGESFGVNIVLYKLDNTDDAQPILKQTIYTSDAKATIEIAYFEGRFSPVFPLDAPPPQDFLE